MKEFFHLWPHLVFPSPYTGTRAGFPLHFSLPSPHMPSHTHVVFKGFPVCSHANSPGHPNLELSGPSGPCRPTFSLHIGRPRARNTSPQDKGLRLLMNAELSAASLCSPPLGRLHSPGPPRLPICWRGWAVNERAVCVSWLPGVPMLYEVQSIIQDPFWGCFVS